MNPKAVHLIFTLVTLWCHTTCGSYLDLPRLTFTGRVHVDVATMNNDPCNFDINRPFLILNDAQRNWNVNGTGEFKMFDCFITSAQTTNPDHAPDAINGSRVVNNLNMPYPKIADLDVRHQFTSEIYGLHLVILRSNGDVAFQARAEIMPLVQDIWTRLTCEGPGSGHMGSKAVTILTDIKWGNIVGSRVLQELQALTLATHRNLSITFNVFNFGRVGRNLATVVGAIGVAYEGEPLHFAGDRLMTHHDINQPCLPLSSGDSCAPCSGMSVHPPWIFKVPFHINKSTSRLSVDFGNALTITRNGTVRNIGEIWLGIQSGVDGCIHTIGDDVPYREANWNAIGNIVDRILSNEQYGLLVSSQLLVVRSTTVPHVSVLSQHESIGYESFGAAHSTLPILHSCANNALKLEVMLKEPIHFLRPMHHYLGRIEYMQEMMIQLKLTSFGNPVKDETVTITQTEESIPEGGVSPISNQAKTNEQGLVSFTFRVNKKVSPPRHLERNSNCNHGVIITEAPIEGQVYFFNYSTSKTEHHTNQQFIRDTFAISMNRIAVLAFSYFEEPEVPNWIDHVEPIFKQYEQLFPVMNDFIRLGNYTQVTLMHNLHMLKFSMSVDINHPNYMPVTRDLSPSKQRMILKWLHQTPKPMYDDFKDSDDLEFLPRRCTACHVKEEVEETYFQNLYTRRRAQPCTRLLFKYGVQNKIARKRCSLESLKVRLQGAIDLEFATIPLYLTSMYSIIQGHNVDIYKRIRSVVIQEMQHMIQAANILIAIGGKPMIDSKAHVPSYPGHLPGCVLPNLYVTLEKLSRRHVYEVLMGIEVPHNISLDSDNPEIFNDTIGQYYKEIEECITDLRDNDIFVPSLAEKQMKWPWDAPYVGTVLIIKDEATAIQAIQNIKEQGEGASPLDPSMGNSSIQPPFLAHFYNFEEIVCRKHLILNNEGRFCYNGDRIRFDPTGVWPMPPNPRKDTILPGSNCYTAARNFHGAYRSLLRKLQEVFDGNTDGMKDSIAIMYTLAVHGHKVMQINNPSSNEECGLIWDYEWE